MFREQATAALSQQCGKTLIGLGLPHDRTYGRAVRAHVARQTAANMLSALRMTQYAKD